MTTELDSSQASRRIPRFSLRTLLMVIVLVAVGVAFWRQRQELVETRAALVSLRNDIGELTIDDSDEVHAIAIPSYEGRVYRWRVYLPEGRDFQLQVARRMIPESGFPTSNATIVNTHNLTGGTFVLAVGLTQNHLAQWQVMVDQETQQTAMYLDPDETAWLETRTGAGWHQAGDRETVSTDPGTPLQLLRLRKSKEIPGGRTVDMEPTDGILVWIEETP